MYIAADEQAVDEKNGNIAWWLALCSCLGLSLIPCAWIVVLQIDVINGGLLALLCVFSLPMLLIMNITAFFKGFMERRTISGKQALRILGAFWVNMVACLLVAQSWR